MKLGWHSYETKMRRCAGPWEGNDSPIELELNSIELKLNLIELELNSIELEWNQGL